jgi:hypothetical protein
MLGIFQEYSLRHGGVWLAGVGSHGLALIAIGSSEDRTADIRSRRAHRWDRSAAAGNVRRRCSDHLLGRRRGRWEAVVWGGHAGPLGELSRSLYRWWRAADVLHSGDTPASNCGRPGDLRMGKTGEKGLYNMGKRLGTKGGLEGDEFELLPSSNGGAPARDWSSLAAQKARVSGG